MSSGNRLGYFGRSARVWERRKRRFDLRYLLILPSVFFHFFFFHFPKLTTFFLKQHRDLHLGQILVEPTPDSPYSSTGPFDLSSGLACTLVDYGLSRVDTPEGEVLWSPVDQEVFEGVGELFCLFLLSLFFCMLTVWDSIPLFLQANNGMSIDR